MRTIEIILLVMMVFLLGQVWLRPKFTPRWLTAVLPSAALLTMLLHWLLESPRWQMVPTYALLSGLAVYVLIFFLRPQLKRPHPAWGILLMPLSLVAVGLPVVMPVPAPPTPTGLLPVGTAWYDWTDESRPEIYTADPDDKREIMVQFWYPTTAVAASSTPKAPFITNLDVVAPALAQRFNFPSFALDHLSLLQTNSHQNVPVNPAADRYPVIIFSPGYNSMRQQSTSLMEDLASHGYIVIALDHTYVGALTVFPDGRVVFLNPDILKDRAVYGDEAHFASAQGIGEVWQADIAYVLQRLEAGEIDARFQGKLDLAHIGILGHSTGSGVASRFCATDERCAVGVGMDAWLGPVPDNLLDTGTDKPFLFLMSEYWSTAENKTRLARYAQNSPQAEWLTIADTAHYDFSDLPLLTPLSNQIGLSGGIDSYRAQEIIRLYVRTFFDVALKGEGDASLFTNPSLVYPEVRGNQP